MDHGREEKGRRRKRGERRKAHSSITTVKKNLDKQICIKIECVE